MLLGSEMVAFWFSVAITLENGDFFLFNFFNLLFSFFFQLLAVPGDMRKQMGCIQTLAIGWAACRGAV